MKIFKKLSFIAFILLVIANNVSAQSQVINKFSSFRDQWMRPLYPIILGIVFLGGCLFNIGLVWGDDREWKKFFTKVGIFLLAATVIIGVYEAVTALSI